MSRLRASWSPISRLQGTMATCRPRPVTHQLLQHQQQQHHQLQRQAPSQQQILNWVYLAIADQSPPHQNHDGQVCYESFNFCMQKWVIRRDDVWLKRRALFVETMPPLCACSSRPRSQFYTTALLCSYLIQKSEWCRLFSVQIFQQHEWMLNPIF